MVSTSVRGFLVFFMLCFAHFALPLRIIHLLCLAPLRFASATAIVSEVTATAIWICVIGDSDSGSDSDSYSFLLRHITRSA